MSRIVFVEPKNPNPHIYSQFKLPRLGLFILGALMKKRGWDVEVIFEDFAELDVRAVAEADIVGISTITPTAPRAYAIADAVRLSGTPVIMGGPHVTYEVDEALIHCDFVIRGEGESSLMAFIDQWEGARDYSKVLGLSYLQNGLSVSNPESPVVTNLDSIPIPDFSLAKGPVHPVIGGYKTIPIQTSRGCPFNCSFCSVTGMFGKKYRYRSTENILQELRQYNDKKNVIFLCDDNFTDNKKRAKELLRAMIRENFQFKWSTQARVDVATDLELVSLMKEAGCHTVFIGFESTNPENLKTMKKGQTVGQIKEAIRVIRNHGIHIHGMFVFGFDNDSDSTIDETVAFAKNSLISSAQFLLLTPFPGSEIYRQMKGDGRILFNDWSLYDTHHVVIRPRKMPLQALQAAQIKSHERFYSNFQLLRKCIVGDFVGVGIGVYARNLNRWWKKKNKVFCQVLGLMDLRKDVRVSISFEQRVEIPGISPMNNASPSDQFNQSA